LRIVAILLTFIVVSIAATGLFASAASITLTAVKLGADNADVTSCDSAVAVSWTSVYVNDSDDGYVVSTVTVSGVDDVACSGASLKLTLADTAGAVLGSEQTWTVDNTSHAFNVLADDVLAEDVEWANVVIIGP